MAEIATLAIGLSQKGIAPRESRTGQSIGLEGRNLTGERTGLGPLRHGVVAVALFLAVLAVGCGGQAPAPVASKPAVQPHALVSSLRGEPLTFNRYMGRDMLLEVYSHLTHARLVRVNRLTQALEPWLAESWTASPDNLTWTLKLRSGVTFSDGVPFTSADVLFAFTVIYDDKLHSPLGASMRVGDKPLQVSAPDASTVVIRFPAPFGPGLRLLDNLFILPRHLLEPAFKAGTFAKAWSTATPPAEMAGLGPFVLKQYQPGQRLVFERNPRYWRTDERGGKLPRLDRITFEIVPDENAELLALRAGQIDFTQNEVRPDDYASLKRDADAGKLQLLDLGAGLDADAFWINLAKDKPAAASRPWLTRVELRRAISHAVDRRAFVDAVFLGAAVPLYGPITPGNTPWFAPNLPKYDYDPAAARRLLASLGLIDRNGDGILEDQSGAPAALTILTRKGNMALERGSAFVAAELRKVGLAPTVVALDLGALIDRLERRDYESVYFRFLATDLDPALNIDFWMSSGDAHLWNPSQPTPATDWEREIDRLMARQVATMNQAERKAAFDEVQTIMADQLPLMHFAVQHIYLATSRRVTGATPSLIQPMLLWNPDTIDAKATR